MVIGLVNTGIELNRANDTTIYSE